MQVTRSKLVALVIALGYFVTVVVMQGWEKAVVLSFLLLLPVAFIWFPNEIEAFTAMLAKRPFSRTTQETPAFMVTIVGWLWLVGYLPLMAYLLSR